MQDSGIQVLDTRLFRDLIDRARQSPRLRTNHNFHASLEDNPHRFLNVIVKGIPRITARVLGRDPVGIDIRPGVWHTMVVLSAHAICYEVKPGPYSAPTDKEFASWAPRLH